MQIQLLMVNQQLKKFFILSLAQQPYFI